METNMELPRAGLHNNNSKNNSNNHNVHQKKKKQKQENASRGTATRRRYSKHYKHKTSDNNNPSGIDQTFLGRPGASAGAWESARRELKCVIEAGWMLAAWKVVVG